MILIFSGFLGFYVFTKLLEKVAKKLKDENTFLWRLCFLMIFEFLFELFDLKFHIGDRLLGLAQIFRHFRIREFHVVHFRLQAFEFFGVLFFI